MEENRMDLDDFKEKARKKAPFNADLVKKLKKHKKALDPLFHQNHYAVFEKMDCLDCANCCKTTSPIVLDSDIARMSKTLKIKPSELIAQYLKVDEEGDYVFTQAPCPFLGMDNKCLVYDSRPKACREYPHTNRKRIYQILNLTKTNALICPAVDQILDRVKQQMDSKL